jgi:NitT/TauT family transport system ATP-binding protein
MQPMTAQQAGLSGGSVVRVENVSQIYRSGAGDARAVTAIENVSLEVGANEFVSLLGPSGCGKSTLLNIIGGLIRPSAGRVTVAGKLVSGPLPQDIAFVFQESTLFPWYTILENFHVALKFQRVPRAEWDERVTRALDSVGMAAFAEHFPGQLSVGMRQRVNMARGICMGTEILLMDEPFAALDEQTRMVLGEDLSVLLAKTGKAIVFVTHSLAEAVFLSDRIIVFTGRPGRVKRVITVDEPHPRSPDFMLQPRFSEVRNQSYELLRDEIRQTVDAMREARDARAG